MLDLVGLNYKRDKDGNLSEDDQKLWDWGWATTHLEAMRKHEISVQTPKDKRQSLVSGLKEAVENRLPILGFNSIEEFESHLKTNSILS